MLAALAVALAVPAAAQTTVYRWVDKDGKVSFSDTPPPPDAKGASQKNMGGGLPEVSNLPYLTQVAMKKNPVTLYAAFDCGDPCARGRDLLSKRGIPFTEKDIGRSAADTEELRKLTGSTDLPTLMIGAARIKGYDNDAWHGALDAGGYPRTALPGQIVRPAPPPPGPSEPAEAPKQ
jgi:glutaredoxin